VLNDLVATIGHQVHLCRYREVGTLMRWLGPVRGHRVLDVAGGDGYWAGRLRRRGATAVCLDLSGAKLRRGHDYADAPFLVQGDALRLPFPNESFDAVMCVCAIEHFSDGPGALSEIARVLRPGGCLVLSADVLSRGELWPVLDQAHRSRYAVLSTYDHERLTALLVGRGLALDRYSYLFRGLAAEHLYLAVSARGGRAGWNATAPLAPLVALDDRRQPNTQGSIVCIRALKVGP
jgi:SAM-dependent methyltransferase